MFTLKMTMMKRNFFSIWKKKNAVHTTQFRWSTKVYKLRPLFYFVFELMTLKQRFKHMVSTLSMYIKWINESQVHALCI